MAALGWLEVLHPMAVRRLDQLAQPDMTGIALVALVPDHARSEGSGIEGQRLEPDGEQIRQLLAHGVGDGARPSPER